MFTLKEVDVQVTPWPMGSTFVRYVQVHLCMYEEVGLAFAL